jgi:hypothetical protein
MRAGNVGTPATMTESIDADATPWPVQPMATVSTCSSPSTAHTTLATIGTGGDSVCSGTQASRLLLIG